MLWKTHFHLHLGSNPLSLRFMWILVFWKMHSSLKLIFSVTELQQSPKFDIFQKWVFNNPASNTNLVLNSVPIAAGQYLWKSFSTKNWSFLEFPCIFKEVNVKQITKALTSYCTPKTRCPEQLCASITTACGSYVLDIFNNTTTNTINSIATNNTSNNKNSY